MESTTTSRVRDNWFGVGSRVPTKAVDLDGKDLAQQESIEPRTTFQRIFPVSLQSGRRLRFH